MYRIKLFLLFVICSISFCFAQNPIRWRSSVKMTDKAEGVVLMKAIVQPGWHLYGIDLPKGGPKSTSFDFSDSVGIELIGTVSSSTTPIEVFDNMFQLKLNWWDSNVTFTQRFKVTGNNPMLKGSITYMGCNDETCTPPRKESISLSIPVKK